MKSKPQLIVALDVDTLSEAEHLVKNLASIVNIFKVGSQLFTIYGPQVVQFIQKQGKKVFLDLKFHDIPNTVSASTSGAIVMSVMRVNSSPGTKIPGLFMFTVHTQGGEAMLRAAVKASKETAEKHKIPPPFIVGVTVLTSDQGKDIPKLVVERAILAKQAGLDGVVASVEEAKLIRQEIGKDFLIVTPGIRPAGEEAGDQQRIATPTQAVENGSDYLVVGRPIVKAADPVKAAKKILEEIRAVSSAG